MNKKNIFKFILIISFLFLSVLNFNINTVRARDIDAFDHGIDTANVSDNFGLGELNEYRDGNISSQKFEKKVAILLALIKYIGVVLSVIILIIIGIKYMIGSVEQKADYKKTMMPYLYGTLFLFAGSFVPQLIYEIVKNIGWI